MTNERSVAMPYRFIGWRIQTSICVQTKYSGIVSNYIKIGVGITLQNIASARLARAGEGIFLESNVKVDLGLAFPGGKPRWRYFFTW